jgi:hypothetical protein
MVLNGFNQLQQGWAGLGWAINEVNWFVGGV